MKMWPVIFLVVFTWVQMSHSLPFEANDPSLADESDLTDFNNDDKPVVLHSIEKKDGVLETEQTHLPSGDHPSSAAESALNNLTLEELLTLALSSDLDQNGKTANTSHALPEQLLDDETLALLLEELNLLTEKAENTIHDHASNQAKSFSDESNDSPNLQKSLESFTPEGAGVLPTDQNVFLAPQLQFLEPDLGPAVLPLQVPKDYFVPFIPRQAFGVVNGAARPAFGHASFYRYRPRGLVDVRNSPAFGYLLGGAK